MSRSRVWASLAAAATAVAAAALPWLHWPRLTLPAADAPYPVAFSPDGSLLLTHGSGDRKPHLCRVWDARTGRPVSSFTLGAEDLREAAFSPDGPRLFVVTHRANNSSDYRGRLVEVRTGRVVAEYPLYPSHRAETFAFSPDGAWLVYGARVEGTDTRDGVRLVPLRGGAEVTLPRAVAPMAFSPDGRLLAACTDLGSDRWTFTLWDLASGGHVLSLIEPELLKVRNRTGASLARLTFSPDGSALVLASGIALDGAGGVRPENYPHVSAIRVWDMARGAWRFGLTATKFVGLTADGDAFVVERRFFLGPYQFDTHDLTDGRRVGSFPIDQLPSGFLESVP